MNTDTLIRHSLILAGLSLAAHAVHATPSSLQSWISSDCQAYHIMNSGNSSVLRQIEAGCPAGNAANAFTGGARLEYAGVRTSKAIGEHIGTIPEDVWGEIASQLGSESVFNDGTGPTAAGRSAGGAYGNIGIWGNVSNASLDDTFVNTPFKSNDRNAIIGADLLVNERFIVGAAFGYEDSNVETLLNAGHQDISGYTLSGYAAASLGRHISLDGNFGYANTDIDQTRLVSAFEVAAGTALAGAGAGATAGSSVNADRWFVAVNLNGNWDFNHVLVNGHGGYLYSRENQDASTETAASAAGALFTSPIASRSFELGQWRIGGELSYDYQSFLEPFVGLDYLYNNTRTKLRLAPGLKQPSNDRSELQYTAGMRYFGDNGISGTVQYTVSGSKTDMNYSAFMLTLRLDL